MIYFFSKLGNVVLYFPLEELIYLGYQLLLVGSDCIFLLLYLLMIYDRALIIGLCFQWHNHDLKLFLRLLRSYS